MWRDSVAAAPGPAGWQQGGARLCGSPSGRGGPQGWQVTHGHCLSVPTPAPSHVPSSPCCPMAPAQQAGSAVPMHGEMTWWHSARGHLDEPAGAGGGWRGPAHCGAVGIDPCKQQLPQQSQGKWGSSGRLEIEKMSPDILCPTALWERGHSKDQPYGLCIVLVPVDWSLGRPGVMPPSPQAVQVRGEPPTPKTEVGPT